MKRNSFPRRIDIISILPDYVNWQDCLSIYLNSAFLCAVHSQSKAIDIIDNHLWAGYKAFIVWGE